MARKLTRTRLALGALILGLISGCQLNSVERASIRSAISDINVTLASTGSVATDGGGVVIAAGLINNPERSRGWPRMPQKRATAMSFVNFARGGVPDTASSNFYFYTRQCFQQFAMALQSEVFTDFDLPATNEGLTINFELWGKSEKLALQDHLYRERHKVSVLFPKHAGNATQIYVVIVLSKDAVAYWDFDDGSWPDLGKYSAFPLDKSEKLNLLAEKLLGHLSTCSASAP